MDLPVWMLVSSLRERTLCGPPSLHVQAHGGLHWRTLGEKNATDCGVRGRLLWAAAEKGSGTHF